MFVLAQIYSCYTAKKKMATFEDFEDFELTAINEEVLIRFKKKQQCNKQYNL